MKVEALKTLTDDYPRRKDRYSTKMINVDDIPPQRWLTHRKNEIISMIKKLKKTPSSSIVRTYKSRGEARRQGNKYRACILNHELKMEVRKRKNSVYFTIKQ